MGNEELGRRHLAERLMGLLLVIILDPVFGDFPDLPQSAENVKIKHLFAIGAIEAFDVRILGWLAGLDMLQHDASVFSPFGHSAGDQLWPLSMRSLAG